MQKRNVQIELNKLANAQDSQNKELHLMRERLAAAYGLEDTVSN